MAEDRRSDSRGAQHQPEGVVAEARRDSEVPFSNGHLSLLFQDPTPTHGKGVPRIYIYNIFIPFFSGRSPDSGIIRNKARPSLKKRQIKSGEPEIVPYRKQPSKQMARNPSSSICVSKWDQCVFGGRGWKNSLIHWFLRSIIPVSQ